MTPRWLTLPRGSGPALRVQVIAMNGKRRRKVMRHLMDHGWASCSVRALFRLTPAQFAKVQRKLSLIDGFFKPRKISRQRPALWPVEQLCLFVEVRHDHLQ